MSPQPTTGVSGGPAWAGAIRAPFLSGLLAFCLMATASASPIDRFAVVRRHDVVVTKPDRLVPLTVGNGEFAFTADITGLQTFPGFHDAPGGIPLGTQAQWGWHSRPNRECFTRDEVFLDYPAHGRSVPYLDGRGEFEPDDPSAARLKAAAAFLRANPHRIDLGRVALRLRHADGRDARIDDLTDTRQQLDLWAGTLSSRFQFDGQTVEVVTACHPEEDTLAVRITSPLVADKRLAVALAIPASKATWREAADWSAPPEAHRTDRTPIPNGARLVHREDAAGHRIDWRWSTGAMLADDGPHRFVLSAPGQPGIEFTVAFGPLAHPDAPDPPDCATTMAAAARHWASFWQHGGIIDLSGSRDPRWHELERRIVLSQYLVAVNCAGSTPPQETGLVFNSWFGKFHLEMHWWHAAHFALWGHADRLARSLGYYQRILPQARATAARQGYAGARWPKMTDPDGNESPSNIGVFLIWQQPHPLYLAELMYRARPTQETLGRYRDLVIASADFMASYAAWDGTTGCYVLGPPLIPAQENYWPQRGSLLNPTFELAYWHWALKTARQWRDRLGLPRDPLWDKVADGLARPTVRDGHYAAIGTEPFTRYGDHPSMLMALGFVPPTPLVDAAVMSRTLDDVLAKWPWADTWGWDFPVVAMTAARLGRTADALNALLMDTPKNRYLPNGHNWQDDRLPVYLPGNGGLLYAVAMMAAGWDGCPAGTAPGFPRDGSWTVRHDGLRPAP